MIAPRMLGGTQPRTAMSSKIEWKRMHNRRSGTSPQAKAWDYMRSPLRGEEDAAEDGLSTREQLNGND
jgi:transcription elongation factor